MPGVISTGRLHETTPRKNVAVKTKLTGIFLFLLNISLFVAVFPLIYLYSTQFNEEGKIKTDGDDELIAALIFYILVLQTLSLIILSMIAYFQCCLRQVVSCSIGKACLKITGIILVIIGILLVKLLSLSSYSTWLKIVTTAYIITVEASYLGVFYFAKKNCQCKKCLVQKDVKITFLGSKLSLYETNLITKRYLVDFFKIATTHPTRLAIQIDNGAIIHEFSPSSYGVHLPAGEYVVRQYTMILNPALTDAGANVSTPSNKLGVKDQAVPCTIMTID